MDRECGAIDAQASMTIASSPSVAALSAALLDESRNLRKDSQLPSNASRRFSRTDDTELETVRGCEKMIVNSALFQRLIKS
jgi:hypothetical protein